MKDQLTAAAKHTAQARAALDRILEGKQLPPPKTLSKDDAAQMRAHLTRAAEYLHQVNELADQLRDEAAAMRGRGSAIS